MKWHTIPTWQRRRSAINHNWLQNQYLVFLLALLEYSSHGFVEEVFEAEVVNQLIQWLHHRKDVETLIDTVDEMSPREVIQTEAGICIPDADRAWLGEVAHRCWSHRFGIQDLVDHAKAQIAAADEAYDALVAAISFDPSAVKHWEAVASMVRGLHGACFELSQAISRLPSHVEIT